eukprot:6002189-Alexandrium_andersonii.AAC.1
MRRRPACLPDGCFGVSVPLVVSLRGPRPAGEAARAGGASVGALEGAPQVLASGEAASGDTLR